jgi:hypothetical protein
MLPLDHPCPQPSARQIWAGLCGRAYLMAILQAGGVYLIAHGSLWAGLTGFLISWNWASASRAVNGYQGRGVRLAYASGGALGTLTVLAVSRYFST